MNCFFTEGSGSGGAKSTFYVRKVDPVRPIWQKVGTGKQLATRNKPAEIFGLYGPLSGSRMSDLAKNGYRHAT